MKFPSIFLPFATFIFLTVSVFSSQAQVATEYPLPSELKAPSDMTPRAKEGFYKRLEIIKQRQDGRKQEKINPESITSIQTIPIRVSRFTPLRTGVERLLNTPDMFSNKQEPPFTLTDLSKTPLNNCETLKSIPAGPQLEKSFAGNIRFLRCPDIGTASLEETLMYSDRHAEIITRNSVNATIPVGGIKRGVIASRIRNEEGNEGITRIQWRSGDKNIVLRLEGFDDKTADHAQRIAAGFPD